VVSLNWKGFTVLAVVVGSIILFVFQMDRQQQQTDDVNDNVVSESVVNSSTAKTDLPDTMPTTNTPQVQGSPLADKLAPGTTLPPGHRALTDMSPARSTAVANSEAFNKAHSKFTHFQIGNRNVKSIHTAEGAVWVGTSGGAIRYDTKSNEYQLYNVRNGLLANGVFDISTVNDKIAVGTYGGGLAILDDTVKQWKIYNVPEGLGDAFVYQTLQMSNGDIWIATWTGANRIKAGKLDDPQAWEIYTVENTNGGVPNDWVYGLAEGKNGELWMATEGGLARFSDNTWSNWKHSDGLGAAYEKVRDQNPFKNDPAKFSSHHARQKVEQGLQDVDTAYNPNYIIALVVDDEGYVWAGTWGAGLARFDGKTWKNYTMDDGLPANHVFMLYKDDKNNLWVGTSKGLTRFDAQRSVFKNFTKADGLFSEVVFSMTIDSEGTYWIGSFGGVAKIKYLN